jgi:hypothetical protein
MALCLLCRIPESTRFKIGQSDCPSVQAFIQPSNRCKVSALDLSVLLPAQYLLAASFDLNTPMQGFRSGFKRPLASSVPFSSQF